MQKNFVIRNLVELIVRGRVVDLHNLYAPAGIGTDPRGETAVLTLRRDRRWAGAEALPEVVTLTFSGNVRIAFNDLLAASGTLHEESVEIAYYDGECGWDSFLDERLAAAQGSEGLHIGFSGGLALRIRADFAEAALD
jgi:hypothetical protein